MTQPDNYGALEQESNKQNTNTTGPFKNPNVTTLLNERKCRLILYSGALLSWSIPQASIIGDDVEADQCGGTSGVDDYCWWWLIGFSICTVAELLILICAYWSRTPMFVNWIVSIILVIGGVLVMIGTFDSLSDLCSGDTDTDACRTGIIAPTFFAVLICFAVAVDLVSNLLGNARIRVFTFAFINFLMSLLICIWIFDYVPTFFFESPDDTIKAGWLAFCVLSFIIAILTGLNLWFLKDVWQFYVLVGILYFGSILLADCQHPSFLDSSKATFLFYVVASIICIEVNLFSRGGQVGFGN